MFKPPDQVGGPSLGDPSEDSFDEKGAAAQQGTLEELHELLNRGGASCLHA